MKHMTTTENHHANTAQLLSPEDPSALLEATLAVAYEARTANLIAMFQNPALTVQNLEGNTLTWSLTEKQLGPLLEQIVERLGLTK